MSRGSAILLILIGIGAFVVAYRTPHNRPDPQVAVFGDLSLTLEYATTAQARELGLGGRETVPHGYGMLFVFPKEGYHGFWMKDMQVPIDIFWLDDKGHVVFIAADVATSTYPHVFYPLHPAKYVLETEAGVARVERIAIGTSLILKKFPNVTK